jgi:ABC-2 type transport system permease protein
MKKSLFITLKEVRGFFHDKGDLSFSLLLPVIIFAMIFGAFGGQTQFNGTAYIVNQDSGKYSTLLIDKLSYYEGLNIQFLTSEEADRKLARSDIQMVLEIPSGFSDRLIANQPAQLLFKQRGNGGTEGQIVASLIRGAAENISQNLLIQSGVKAKLADTKIAPQTIEITVQKFIDREESNPVITLKETLLGANIDPVNQFLPGILTMFVLFSINLTAQALVEERRRGTLERLLTTRLTVQQLFTGKFLAYVLRGFIQTLILLLLAHAVFGLFTPVSFLAALVVALVFAAAASTLGLIIGSISRTENQAVWISVFFTMFMVMISGTFFPITPGTALDTLSHFSLNTYAIDAFKTVINQGTLAGTERDILILLAVAVAGLIVSRFIFKVNQGGK